ncbi:class I SAM-dependent methyltransferase [Segetibacter sp. 3557_3]|uniref:class I SAM-dependent methyltransferase n=1 Tax=Segetibacter sp. 3557_3 TaxID=2547429 RepID=UPI001058FEB4|nr:class I SAM-dependent methyltransferase [Segetibacter sp. 3557_3]TDH28591.1 class I SAM-dependent methyltransferase [Segetibacter sp. 3557_3]
MNTAVNTRTNALSFLQNIIKKGGPETGEYAVLNTIFDDISADYKSGKMSEQEVQLLQEGFGDECMENTLHGHVKLKPFGYAGDFLIIDKIYREQVTTDQRFEKWDIFWNNHAAARAVRNRKDYFISMMTHKLVTNPSLHLLNVASGPARDIAELYGTIDSAKLHTVCVEADATAINYAKELNASNASMVSFIHKNVFRFTPEDKFDVVWSAGLFDYFDEKVFIRLLTKFMSWTKQGGEVIIGNFSNENPSRNYMELVGDWYLQHRSKEQLVELAIKAGANKEQIHVGQELEGVNLFLHVQV